MFLFKLNHLQGEPGTSKNQWHRRIVSYVYNLCVAGLLVEKYRMVPEDGLV
jgi:hypothetical protein